MLDIGLSELLLIAVAALVVVGPKDLPVVIRHIAKWMRGLREFYIGARVQAMKLADEAGLSDLRETVVKTTTIVDLDGKPQVAYDVGELEELSRNSSGEAARVSFPHRGKGWKGADADADLPLVQSKYQPPSHPSPDGGRSTEPDSGSGHPSSST